jgi:hypothetical protein
MKKLIALAAIALSFTVSAQPSEVKKDSSEYYVDWNTDSLVSSAGILYLASDAVLYSSMAVGSVLLEDNPESAVIVSVGGVVVSAVLRTIGHIKLSLVGRKIKIKPKTYSFDKDLIDIDWN